MLTYVRTYFTTYALTRLLGDEATGLLSGDADLGEASRLDETWRWTGDAAADFGKRANLGDASRLDNRLGDDADFGGDEPGEGVMV